MNHLENMEQKRSEESTEAIGDERLKTVTGGADPTGDAGVTGARQGKKKKKEEIIYIDEETVPL